MADVCNPSTHCCVVETSKGFVGLAERGGRLLRSTLPQRSRHEALRKALAGLGIGAVEDARAFGDLPERIASYLSGEEVEFADVTVDTAARAPFGAAVKIVAYAVFEQLQLGCAFKFGDANPFAKFADRLRGVAAAA